MPKLLAQISVTGDFDSASSKGFKVLADFIFGNNSSIKGDTKIDMTAPVEMVPKLVKTVLMPVLTTSFSSSTTKSHNTPEVLLSTQALFPAPLTVTPEPIVTLELFPLISKSPQSDETVAEVPLTSLHAPGRRKTPEVPEAISLADNPSITEL